MAEEAVGFVLNQIGTLLLQERKLLSGLRSEIEGIKDDLKIMQAFLRDADSREENDAVVKAWVEQMRAVAYDTEDALDEFVLLIAKQPRPSNPFIRFLCKTAWFIKYWKENHQIAIKIQSIKKKVQDIKERSQTFQFRLDHQVSSSTYKLDPRGDDALFISESEVVGIKERRGQILKLLLNGNPNLKVVSVVGMAGLGKTTLVKKVYDFSGVKESFQCHAWIIVSQSFQIEQILRDMLKQLFGEIKQPTPQVVDTMNRVGLKEVLKEFLQQKRYMIVFDDIWTQNAWDDLKHALPDDKNSSRIMITTRIANVASYSSRSTEDIYQLQPLKQEDAWELFRRTAFRSDCACPSELQPLSEKILSKCRGLPLAILIIASLLSTKDHKIEEWQSVLLRTQIESNAKLNDMKKMIMLGYDDLPYYLKSCLLYLSMFPEDYRFKRTKVVRLWVAEGFVEGKHIGSNAEYVAEGYFNELVNRSFIQATHEYSIFEGRVLWQVHDLIHEAIVQKSHDQSFATVLGEEEQSMTPDSPKIRRLSIHKSNERFLISGNENENFCHLRSLLLFDISSSSVPTFSWGAFQLLKVLDLEGAPLEVFPKEIVRLFHLRFLSLKSTKIKTIPSSIGMLSKLETLDLKLTFVTKLPFEILKLRRLRHLLGDNLVLELPLDSPPTFDCFQRSTLMPNGIGNLQALQTLTNIEANLGTNIARELKSLTQLKRLGIKNLRREDGIHLCASIEKMTNLRYLGIQAAQEEIIDLESLTSPSPLLRKLEIRGHLNKYPHWMPSLHNLEKLYIADSRLTTDPLEALQALPRLVELDLKKIYDGEQLCFQAGGFQRLLFLGIGDLENLRSVKVEKGAIPLVQTIMIYDCALLEKAPIGIEVLNNLKELIIGTPHPKLGETLNPERGGQDRERLSNIPLIMVLYETQEYREGILWRGNNCKIEFIPL